MKFTMEWPIEVEVEVDPNGMSPERVRRLANIAMQKLELDQVVNLDQEGVYECKSLSYRIRLERKR